MRVSRSMFRPAAALLMALMLGLLAGCQRPVVLMPTPLVFASGEVDPFADTRDELRTPDLPVFYATNREVLVQYPLPVHTIFPSPTLRFGMAHFDVGEPGFTWDQLHALSTSAKEGDRPALRLRRLDQLAELGPSDNAAESRQMQAFFALVNRALANSPVHEIVVYVHGANNAMHRGTGQAAQFRHFAGRNVVVLSFVWPSAERLRTYGMDLRHAHESQPQFARLITMLGENTTAKKIDVMAYSAGATVATGGLALLGTPRPGESREQLKERLRLGVVYYAAPDADTRGFVSDLERYADLADRVTVTANMGDATLRLAQRHQGSSRIGRPDPTELNEEQARFLIDASERMGFDLIKLDPVVLPGLRRMAHTYWQTDTWISSDMFTLFRYHGDPAARGLVPVTLPGGGRFWEFPKDYDQRIVGLMKGVER
ncbi:alpha/beta hydrolase [Rivibacter subsaxonicus]|uniref:Esterase/lipase superfamily enzyme n=1 Tax=Rivibacter subsaxonicus TaxID=457575 RepID=A0A4Q7W234_9BURK|nr:alpha/beta hydrolase [Rivibacter subsaxonicus]RZU02629.1 esterase/lipase superfamily enzyme [Rivibacter subsaxonicus]